MFVGRCMDGAICYMKVEQKRRKEIVLQHSVPVWLYNSGYFISTSDREFTEMYRVHVSLCLKPYPTVICAA